ncbi:hypothetical protein OG709_00250 [Streptomyces sp. NBC_01267]|uniref:hypothetical protein n=1 Tax=Streptomyces sp. NBC_01267 TaxID=2903805 RepID=UPI002E37F3CF|nr:hypothetical protein [Streptomyces sp. NBC_01267]
MGSLFGFEVKCGGDPAEGQQGLAVRCFCPSGQQECGFRLVDVFACGADQGQRVKDVGLVSTVNRFPLEDVAGLGSDDGLEGDRDVRGRPTAPFVIECSGVAAKNTSQRSGLVVVKGTGNGA